MKRLLLVLVTVFSLSSAAMDDDCRRWFGWLVELDDLEKLRSEDVARVYREEGLLWALYRDIEWQEKIAAVMKQSMPKANEER